MPHLRQQNKSTKRYKAKFGSTALQARLGFGGIFMILAVFFIIKCWIISINIFRKALLNMDECFTETLEVDNFALAQETNRITNFRIAY